MRTHEIEVSFEPLKDGRGAGFQLMVCSVEHAGTMYSVSSMWTTHEAYRSLRSLPLHALMLCVRTLKEAIDELA